MAINLRERLRAFGTSSAPLTKRDMDWEEDREGGRVSVGDMRWRGVQTITPRAAFKIPAYWCGVNFLSRTIAALPWKVYRREFDSQERESRTEDRKSAMWGLLHRSPCPGWTSFKWRKSMLLELLSSGAHFAFLEPDRLGGVQHIWPLECRRMRIKEVDGEVGPELEYRYNGKVYKQMEMLDIRYCELGKQTEIISPVRENARALLIAQALEVYAGAYFRGGGMPVGVLTGPVESPQGIANATRDLTRRLEKMGKRGDKILTLPTGHEIKPLGFNPHDSQMEAARRFQVEEIARILSIPPNFLQDLTKGRWSSVEQQDLHLVKHTLSSLVTSIEAEVNYKLFPDEERYGEIMLDELMRGDFKSRVEGTARLVQSGLRTPNEGRLRDNLPPLPGGDELFIQQNMAPLALLEETLKAKMGSKRERRVRNEDPEGEEK